MTQSQPAYKETLAWLYGLQRFGIKLGLENIQRLLGGLDVPSASSRWGGGFRQIIHVAGTNGKGSVCAMSESICRAAGLLTGLFTSPHLVTFRERIQVNGDLISEEDVSRGLTDIRTLVADWEPHPTFFEVVTALALHHFTQIGPDVVILETGLGGRLDATNAILPSVSVITPIDFDHQKWLGDSIQKIAFEKAGIIKPNTPVVSAPQHPEAEEVVRARAKQCNAPVQFVHDICEQTPIALAGTHQRRNAALAIAALRAANIKLSDLAIEQGLGSVKWPARFQRWDDRTIIDGAHNPAAARVLANTWREMFGQQNATLVLAVLADKDVHDICQALAPIADHVLLPPIRSERALPPKNLAEVLSTITPRPQYSIAPSLVDAVRSARARPSPILLAGSLHFAGEVLALLQHRPAAFEECSQ